MHDPLATAGVAEFGAKMVVRVRPFLAHAMVNIGKRRGTTGTWHLIYLYV
jgi:hypothetical protein